VSALREPAAVVAVDVNVVASKIVAELSALRRDEETEVKAKASAGRRRLAIGKYLVLARREWPARGPRAKGWGEFLARMDLPERTARDYMALAGYAEEISAAAAETSDDEVPTYRDAGIDKRPRAEDAQDEPADAESERSAITAPSPAPAKTEPPEHDSDEYYTPLEVLDDARAVLGVIDLDPATCEIAQRRVQARTFYTKAEDGLAREWNGRTWLNPPYSNPLGSRFAEKLIAEYLSGRVTAAILLQNAGTDTAWFHSLAKLGTICLTRGRLGFYRDDDGKLLNQNRMGQVFFYLGPDPDCFASVFGKYGLVGRLHGA
jgi:phage N-6-adenine-methyltransferase